MYRDRRYTVGDRIVDLEVKKLELRLAPTGHAGAVPTATHPPAGRSPLGPSARSSWCY